MSMRERLPPWHERHRLPNGREVLVRPIRPEDAEPLLAGFALLEPDALRAWLLDGRTEFTAADARRLTRLNPKTDFALVATDLDPPGEAVIAAHAHARTDLQARRGEFGIVVSRFIADQGMGRYLLTRLTKWARSRKVVRLEGEMPASNAAMLELADTLSFRRMDTSSHPSLVRVGVELSPPA